MLLFFGLLIALTLFLAFASAAETALFSLSPMRVKAFSESDQPKKRLVAQLLASPRDLLITMLMLNVIMNILIQNVVSSLVGPLSGWLLNVGVPLAITLILGEVIPKSIGLANNSSFAPRIAGFLWTLQQILLPVRKALMRITSGISRTLFFYLQPEQEISGDELHHALRSSQASGILAEDEAQLMRGYLHLQESSAREFLRPREEVLFFDVGEPLSRLIHLFVDQECTRIPICEGGLDHVIGIISSGTFFLHRDELAEPEEVKSLIKKPFFVPESTSALVLLEQMYEKRESLAIVVDEYGAFSGLLALEDLVEAVVGEIIDRRDEKSRYTRAGDHMIIASGKLELIELESLFGITLKSINHMVTIGGWLTEQMGDIPKSGQKYESNGLFFHVLSADEKRVRRLYIRRKP